MAFEMVDGDEGLLLDKCEGFGRGVPDQKGAGEAGPGGGGEEIDLFECDVRLSQCLGEDRPHLEEMVAGGDFGDDTSVGAMEIDLSRDLAGKDLAVLVQDGHGGLVAARLDGENAQ